MTDDDALTQAERDAAADARADADADAAADAAEAIANGEDPDATNASADYSVAFTPRNVAVGMAIVAGLVAFAVSRRRRRRDGDA